jgi:hypothetical protein
MLPGGLCVLGLYAFCGEASFRAAAPALARATAALPSADSAAFAAPDAFLLLHADAGARAKLSARRGVGLKPVEVKPGRAWAQFHVVDACFRVDVALPAGGGAPLRAAAAAALAREAARAADGHVTWRGALPPPGATLGDVLGSAGALAAAASAASPPAAPAALQLWAPPPCVALPAALAGGHPAGDAAPGTLRVEGVIALRAYAYAREPFARAAADLKARAHACVAWHIALMARGARL